METIIKLTYVGRVVSSKNKLCHKYLTEQGDSLLFLKKLWANEVPGSILECIRKDESTFAGPYKIVGSEKDVEKVSQWQVEDRLNYQELQAEKMALKSHDKYYDEKVKELQTIYRNLGYAQRKAFIYNLIQDITK